jgi:tetraacyldisaccharide 4'-kinase
MKIVRFILFPISLLYGCGTWIRNLFFDWGWKKEYKIPFASINVGNLSVGGTGKTPHVLLFLQWLSKGKNIYIISRGYGRKSKGMIWAQPNSNAALIGDEPFLFLQAEEKPSVIVSEKRKVAIDELLKKKVTNALVLLDDSFQHRHVKAGMNILLTDYNQPYFKDYMLPTGDLREFRSGAKRADIVIITKSPSQLSEENKSLFFRSINLPNEAIFFSQIEYSPIETIGEQPLPNKIENIVLVCGIANPKPLEEYLTKKFSLKTVIFPDHHSFTSQDIERIHEIFGKFASDKTIILTTEKDAARLEKFKMDGQLQKYPWCVQKITLKIDREQELKDKLVDYVRTV